ncbi:hypothetical protein [sulfur-oxidizing endosymbiont of Gigantopelta aegis]|uniref:hypothetical protein n=1 Tax=sulfur-oxidizing endosymbiont of Gigantopelta aegis TaxID=2794934 RepID=UPI0018DB44F0|nr:hypothetical protein [sulfur-oxidizing endosymbiont of Gigantopelta aegis]
MNAISGTSSDYLNLVQGATRRNTVTQVVDAKQTGKPVDVEQLQASNQQIRDSARETGVALYSQSLQKQAVETYTKASENAPSYTTGSDSSSDSSSIYSDTYSSDNSNVYTFDAAAVNNGLQTVQKRALGVALYENLSAGSGNAPTNDRPTTLPVNVYV